MSTTFSLKVITPKKLVFDERVNVLTVPASDGEMTILARHTPLVTRLVEGVVKIKKDMDETYLSIGGGYLETDGKKTNILVTRAYHQNEIDEQEVKKAQKEAEKLISESKTKEERHQAIALLRRSLIDMKVIKRRKSQRIIS